ncbi:4-hydroxy-tetrahydrodipicolinate synthase [Alphaproteobacteria bacterium]|nr:4-hydroxy-tetrahydrodipicolinate synthase [Alphaproteobacteria bacterium]
MNYQGSYCALITPFKNGNVDKDSFKNIIKWHIKNGTKGIIPCGTTGESPTLSHEEHKLVVELAIEYAEGKLKVIAGTGSNSTKEAVTFTKHAKLAGADSALVVVPYYNKPSQLGLKEHYLKIADSVDIPLFIYNIPGRSVVDLYNETIFELSMHENIIGIKDATNDLTRPIKFKRNITHKKFFQLSGEDSTQLAYLANGGDGVISVTANIAPKLVSTMHDEWFKENYKLAMDINERLSNINNLLFVESNPCPVKYAANILGMCDYEIRLPLTKITKENEKKIKEELESLSLSFN